MAVIEPTAEWYRERRNEALRKLMLAETEIERLRQERHDKAVAGTRGSEGAVRCGCGHVAKCRLITNGHYLAGENFDSEGWQIINDALAS